MLSNAHCGGRRSGEIAMRRNYDSRAAAAACALTRSSWAGARRDAARCGSGPRRRSGCGRARATDRQILLVGSHFTAWPPRASTPPPPLPAAATSVRAHIYSYPAVCLPLCMSARRAMHSSTLSQIWTTPPTCSLRRLALELARVIILFCRIHACLCAHGHESAADDADRFLQGAPRCGSHLKTCGELAGCVRVDGAQTTVAMFGYMTELDTVDIDESKTVEVEVEGLLRSRANKEIQFFILSCSRRANANATHHADIRVCSLSSGHDLLSLLYNLMNEFLFVFGSEDYLVCKEVSITEFDTQHFRIKARGYAWRARSSRLMAVWLQARRAVPDRQAPAGHRGQGHYVLQHANPPRQAHQRRLRHHRHLAAGQHAC